MAKNSPKQRIEALKDWQKTITLPKRKVKSEKKFFAHEEF